MYLEDAGAGPSVLALHGLGGGRPDPEPQPHVVAPLSPLELG